MTLPNFTQSVPDNGYHWWYLDAVSDDGIHALTVIIFVGSVFSPYYAWERRHGRKRAAMEHCAVNVALYGPHSRWSMTERNQTSVMATTDTLAIGHSEIRVKPGELSMNINEISVPWPSRVSGNLRIALPDYSLSAHALDHHAVKSPHHFWQPIAPQARISVAFSHPELNWQGNAYVDSNYGSIPLEHSFKSWTWSRSHGPNNQTTVLYDVLQNDNSRYQKSLLFDSKGHCSETDAPVAHRLKPTRYWRIPRSTRTPKEVLVKQLQTLEDTPFYSRSRYIETDKNQEQITIHESLDLQRFSTPWVQCLLPFRMPRKTHTVLRSQ